MKIIIGLKAGDSVVIDGVVKISDGDIVEINSRPEKSNNVAVGTDTTIVFMILILLFGYLN